MESVEINEGLLHRMKLIAVCDALDCRHGIADGRCQSQAGQHAPAVHMHCARTALTVITALLRAGERQFFAQHVQEGAPGVGTGYPDDTVYLDAQADGGVVVDDR